jgi:muramidase (phage lysozyme)
MMVFAPSTTFAGDAWVRGSSFGSDVKHATGWSQSGFAASPEVSWGAADVQRDHGSVSRFVFDPSLSPLANLRNLIASAEAGAGGYDAVAYGADVSPPARASTLRLGEVRAWVEATPGQNHAIGRYQVIPETFERLAKATASADDANFDRSLQDRWANVLIEEAGYSAFLGGDISPDVFMDRLAQLWAGLPLGDGRSAYEGVAGNRATIGRSAYARAVAQIFPAQAALAADAKLALDAQPPKTGP